MKIPLSTEDWVKNQIKDTYVQSMERLSITSFVVAWIAIIIGSAIILWVSVMWILGLGL